MSVSHKGVFVKQINWNQTPVTSQEDLVKFG